MRAAIFAIPCGKYYIVVAAYIGARASPAMRRMRRSTSYHAHQQGNEEDHQEDEEQNLGDFRCASGDAAKAEHRGDDGDDEEDDSVSKHGASHRWIAEWISKTATRCASTGNLPVSGLQQQMCPRRHLQVRRFDSECIERGSDWRARCVGGAPHFQAFLNAS